MPSLPPLLLLLLSLLPSTHAAQVIGAGESLHIGMVSTALIGIIAFTIAYEYMTEHIEHQLEGTPYMKIVNQVYKELTIMGLVSFIIFMMNQSGPWLLAVYDGQLFLAFEYAHILIFFIALMIILTAVYLCYLNYRTSQEYLNTELNTIDELMSEYTKVKSSKWQSFLYKQWWLPCRLRTDFEFKLLHNFFVEAYFVPPSFDFGMYLSECMDIQVVELVEVDISSWIALCVFIILNMVRVEVGKAIEGDADNADDYSLDESRRRHLGVTAVDCSVAYSTDANSTDAHRMLGAAVDPCAPIETGTVITFLIFGWGILGVSIFLMVAARTAFANLMKKAGCKSISLYHSKLVQVNAKGNSKFALAKAAMKRRKGALAQGNEGTKEGGHGKMVDVKGWGMLRHRLNRNQNFVDDEVKENKLAAGIHALVQKARFAREEAERKALGELTTEQRRALSGIVDDDVESGRGTAESGEKMEMKDLKFLVKKEMHAQHAVHAITSPEGKARESNQVAFAEEKEKEEEAAEMALKFSNPGQSAAKPHMEKAGAKYGTSRGSRGSVFQQVEGRGSILSVDLRDIYWNGKSELFAKTVDVLLLLLAAYFAMMATNFGPLSTNMGTSWLYQLLMALPGFLTVFPLTVIISINSKLKAVSVLDIEVVAKILEEHEEAQILKHEVVRKFLKSMEIAGYKGKGGLKKLFDTVDTDGSGEIDSAEFKAMLNSQQVFFTNKMFLHLFHVFDVDNDNAISLEELESICFPGEDEEEEELYHNEDLHLTKQKTGRTPSEKTSWNK